MSSLPAENDWRLWLLDHPSGLTADDGRPSQEGRSGRPEAAAPASGRLGGSGGRGGGLPRVFDISGGLTATPPPPARGQPAGGRQRPLAEEGQYQDNHRLGVEDEPKNDAGHKPRRRTSGPTEFYEPKGSHGITGAGPPYTEKIGLK